MIKPIQDVIWVKIANEPEKTAGGLYIPDQAKGIDKPTQGEVIAAGNGYTDKTTGQKHKMSVKVGDKILFSERTGVEMKFEGQDYLVMRDRDVLAVVE